MSKKTSDRARLVYQFKELENGGYIREVRIWKLPEPSAEQPHGFKYSLFFGRPGERIIGYDNELGKGDHRHYGRDEEPYVFESLEKLVADFEDDIQRYKSRD